MKTSTNAIYVKRDDFNDTPTSKFSRYLLTILENGTRDLPKDPKKAFLIPCLILNALRSIVEIKKHQLYIYWSK